MGGGGRGGLRRKKIGRITLKWFMYMSSPPLPPSPSVHRRRAKIGQNYRGKATWIVDILKNTVSCKFNLYLHHKEYLHTVHHTHPSWRLIIFSKTVEKFHETIPFKGHDAQRYGKICAMRAWHVWLLGSDMQGCLTERFKMVKYWELYRRMYTKHL